MNLHNSLSDTVSVTSQASMSNPTASGAARSALQKQQAFEAQMGGKGHGGSRALLPLTCLEFASSRFRSHREAALRSQQVRWCWRPEAAVHAGRGTGQGSVWPALRSGGARAAAGASWPVGA